MATPWLTATAGSDRRRIAAVMDALGLTHLEARSREDPDVLGFVEPVEIATVMVDLPRDLVALQGLLERELEPRLRALADVGLLTQVDPRLATKGSLVEAGERARGRLARDRGAYFEALRVHAQAMLLVHALELLETQGPRPLADFLGRLGLDGAASRAQRSLSKSQVLRDAALMARALEHVAHPKFEALLEELRGLYRQRPGAGALVFAQYRDTVAWLADRLSQPAPVGLGRPVRAFVGGAAGGDGPLQDLREGKVSALVATSVAEEGIDVPEVDLVAFFEAVPSAIRAVQRRGRTGRRRAGRVVVFVTRDSRDEGALRASQSRERAQEKVIESIKSRERTGRRPALEEFAAPPGR